MKANELRIGNVVYIDESTIVEIESISEIGANSRHGSDTIYFDNIACFGEKSKDIIKPIPLTEEWLLKFKFEELEKDCRTFFKKGKFKVELSSGGNVYYDRNIFISSVHQLQNLYFALTGEELTFKSE